MNTSFEVVFIYDCGKDNSWNVLEKLKYEYPNLIKLIKLSRNFGQHNALICGFEFATGDFLITMDEDLQHAPEDIIKLIKESKLKVQAQILLTNNMKEITMLSMENMKI